MSDQPSSGSLRLPQVLIVDDDPSVLEVARCMARALGWQALVCNDPKQALEFHGEHAGSIEVVLLDLHMPGASGHTLAQAIRERHAATRIVLMTGDLVEDTGAAGRGCAHDFVLYKPFNLSGLKQAIAGDVDTTRAA